MNEICTNDRPITKEEVRQLTRNLKQGKVPWLDNVCGEYLKNAKADTTQFLTLLFNNIYNSSCFRQTDANPLLYRCSKVGIKTTKTIIGLFLSSALLAKCSLPYKANNGITGRKKRKNQYRPSRFSKTLLVDLSYFYSDLHNKKRILLKKEG